MSLIISLLFFYKDGIAINWLNKIDMPLYEEIRIDVMCIVMSSFNLIKVTI